MALICPLPMADQIKQCNQACKFYKNDECLLVKALELYIKDKSLAREQSSSSPQTKMQLR